MFFHYIYILLRWLSGFGAIQTTISEEGDDVCVLIVNFVHHQNIGFVLIYFIKWYTYEYAIKV